jgi:hypothetical protein
MTKFDIFSTQIVLNFVSFGLLAFLYAYPQLKKLPLKTALSILVFCSAFRQLGLIYLHPVLTGANPSSLFSILTAYGDLVVALLAIISVIGLQKNKSWSIPLVWVFNILGIVDFINAYTFGFIDHAWNFLTGAGWFVPVVIVPFITISHILIFILLLKAPKE